MTEDEIKNLQSPGGDKNCPAEASTKQDKAADSRAKDIQRDITAAIEKGVIQKENISQGGTPVPPEIPHARERLVLSGIAMVISMVATVSPFTPADIRPGTLTIATLVVSSLVKPFEKN